MDSKTGTDVGPYTVIVREGPRGNGARRFARRAVPAPVARVAAGGKVRAGCRSQARRLAGRGQAGTGAGQVTAASRATARQAPGRRGNVPGRAHQSCAGRSRRTRRLPGPRRACPLVPALPLTGRRPGSRGGNWGACLRAGGPARPASQTQIGIAWSLFNLLCERGQVIPV